MSASGTAVLVGLLGLQTSTSRVATVISRSIASQVVARVPVERDRHRAGTGGGAEMRIDRERRPRVHELGARLEQRLAGGEQDVARAVADRDPRHGDAVAVAQTLAQQRVGRVGVAVERAERAIDRVAHGRQRRVGRLVAGEAHERLLLGVAAGGGVDRNPPDAL